MSSKAIKNSRKKKPVHRVELSPHPEAFPLLPQTFISVLCFPRHDVCCPAWSGAGVTNLFKTEGYFKGIE